MGALLCSASNRWGCVQVGEAAIHQRYTVAFHSVRFTAVKREADWKRNEKSVLIKESACQPLLPAYS